MTAHPHPSIPPDHGGKFRLVTSRSGLWLLLIVLSLAWSGFSPIDRGDPLGATSSDATPRFSLVAHAETTCADGPVISLRQWDNATSAHVTKADALRHFNGEHDGESAFRWDFFDACGRQLHATVDSYGQLLDLLASSDLDLLATSDASYADDILGRVRARSQHVQKVLQSEVKDPVACEMCSNPVLTFTERAIPFEEFASQLAEALTSCDPKCVDHRAGFWHNIFGH